MVEINNVKSPLSTQDTNNIETNSQSNQPPKEYSYGFRARLNSVGRYLSHWHSAKRREVVIKKFSNTSIPDISKLKNRSAEVKTALLNSDKLSIKQKIELYAQNKTEIDTYIQKHKLTSLEIYKEIQEMHNEFYSQFNDFDNKIDNKIYEKFNSIDDKYQQLNFYDQNKFEIKNYAQTIGNEQFINGMIFNFIFQSGLTSSEKVKLLVKYSDEVNAYIAQSTDPLICKSIKNIYSNFSLNSQQKTLLESKYSPNILKQ